MWSAVPLSGSACVSCCQRCHARPRFLPQYLQGLASGCVLVIINKLHLAMVASFDPTRAILSGEAALPGRLADAEGLAKCLSRMLRQRYAWNESHRHTRS